ncbi:hypothetical protein IQ264_16460 [Phormidium sp. LEGE 05292]|uniref:hypothetical protein n=1 Tax=[Phormidium] sp. LEGE 05292 TaxID=767427 RepID=UPI00188254BE|nr:hypothetical protein [Phormidium sp. LEGE 05292]MBE9227022.1 hypothetical protein [Phormidium sp. LEGE 05292]
MYKLSFNQLIAGIVIFLLTVYFVTHFPDKIPYLIFALILAFLLANYANQKSANTGFGKKIQLAKNTSSGQEMQLYKSLLQRSQGDRKQVERLIDYERRRSPSSCRTDLLQSAIDRWERDRR